MTRKKLIAVAGFAVPVILAVFLLSGKNGNEVEAITVRLQKYEEKIVAVGQLQLAKETTMISEVSGEIKAIGAEDGDVIPAGSVIISIDDTDRDFQLEQKKAGFENAKAQYQHLLDFDYAAAKEDLAGQTSKKDQAKQSYEAAAELYQQGAMSKIDYMKYKADYEAAAASWNTAKLKVQSLEEGGALRSSTYAQLQSAQASYESALNDQQKYHITAPWTAVVLKTYINEHDYVQPGDQLADIGEAGSYHVVADLDEKYYPYLSKGMKAMISVGDLGKSDEMEGSVEVISPKINSDTGTFQVKIGVPEDFPYLASDLTVNVEIMIEEKENAIVIPGQYLIDGDSGVYLYRNGKAVKTMIQYKTGPSSNLLVTEGLKEGDTVIKPYPFVEDGEAVKISKGVGVS